MKAQKNKVTRDTSTKKTSNNASSSWKIKIFNAGFALLTIVGLLISALGGRVSPGRSASQPTGENQAASLVLSWHRQGKDSNCEDMVINQDGRIHTALCGQSGSDRYLKADQLSQLNDWVAAIQPFRLNQASVLLAFTGKGSRPADTAEQQAIEQFAENLLTH